MIAHSWKVAPGLCEIAVRIYAILANERGEYGDCVSQIALLGHLIAHKDDYLRVIIIVALCAEFDVSTGSLPSDL